MSTTSESVCSDVSTRPGPAGVAVKIVGGGIGGMYAAYLLGKLGFDVELFEASPGPAGTPEGWASGGQDRARPDLSRAYGGRIESRRIEEMCAEFGPMRFEPNLQTRLRALAFHLGIGFQRWTPTDAPSMRNSYSGMTTREESTGEPLTLLKYGVLSMFFAKKVRDNPDDDIDRRVATLTQYMDESIFLRTDGDKLVARSNEEIDAELDALRASAKLNSTLVPLRKDQAPLLKDLGLWNALSYVLTPGAIVAIRDAGTFYHFIQLNVNAAEWGIFWLRQISRLGGVYNFAPKTAPHGVHTLIGKLYDELMGLRNVTLSEGRRVVGVRPAKLTDEVTLAIEDVPKGLASLGEPWARPVRRVEIPADHVVLALPQLPLRDLSEHFPQSVKERIEMVIPLPMLKAFLVTTKPWWSAGLKAQTQTNAVPTRELHYDYNLLLRGTRGSDGRGMVMVYTDTPAITFWQPFIVPLFQHGPVEYFRRNGRALNRDLDPNDRLLTRLVKCLLVDAHLGMQSDLREMSDDIWKAVKREWRAEWGKRPSPATPDEVLGAVREIDKRTGSTVDSPDGVQQNDGAAIRKRINRALRRRPGMPQDDPLAAVAIISDGPRPFGELRKSVLWYAVHDWSRLPFGGAAHVWRPGDTWRPWRSDGLDSCAGLIEFGLAGRDAPGHLKNVHICGEAYSGFQGFIEGALQTAEEVVRAIWRDYGPEPLPRRLIDVGQVLKTPKAGDGPTSEAAVVAERNWIKALTYNLQGSYERESGTGHAKGKSMCENCCRVMNTGSVAQHECEPWWSLPQT